MHIVCSVHLIVLLCVVQVKFVGSETGDDPLQRAYIKLRVNVRLWMCILTTIHL